MNTPGFDAAQYRSTPEVQQGLRLLSRTGTVGRISMLFFLLAVLFLADGLQALMRHEFNNIDMLPGETDMVSGMAPVKVSAIEELRYELEGPPGISFTPSEVFKGFWFGGQMWRAVLSIADNVPPGEFTLTVIDMVPARRKGAAPLTKEQEKGIFKEDADTVFVQNPTLIFTIRVFATEADRTAAQPSFFIHLFHVPSFFLAGVLAIIAITIGLINWKIFSRAEEMLTSQGVYFVHGIKRLDEGVRAAFAHAGHRDFALGEEFVLLDSDWKEQGSGVIVDKNNAKGFAMISPEGVEPKHSWLLIRHTAGSAAKTPGSESEDLFTPPGQDT